MASLRRAQARRIVRRYRKNGVTGGAIHLTSDGPSFVGVTFKGESVREVDEGSLVKEIAHDICSSLFRP